MKCPICGNNQFVVGENEDEILLACYHTIKKPITTGYGQLVESKSVEGVADIEFTNLSGDLFHLYYMLRASASAALYIRLNGITSAIYNYRRFVNDTTIGQIVGENKIYLCYLAEPSTYAVGCLVISGKGDEDDVLTVAHFGGAWQTNSTLLIQGFISGADGDLSSIRIYPDTGLLTGKAKLIKVL